MDRVGKYDIVRRLAQGGFGVVYEGRDPFIKRRVAIKLCSNRDELLRKRFFREAEIAGSLQHVNVVTVFDFGVQDDVPFIVQEFLGGEDLSDKLRRGDVLPVPTKLSYLAQVAQGLEFAHSRGIVHRDIKPSNIRVLEDGTVKIMDFGIARLTSAESPLTQTGTTMGTAGYLAPEQIRGERVDLRADIFSFGVVAYELLGGDRPFRADTLSGVIFQILGKDPEPLPHIWPACPQPIGTLVARCLAKEPSARYPSFTPIVTALASLREQLAPRAEGAANESTATQEAVLPPSVTQIESYRDLEAKIRRTIDHGDITAAELELTLARKRHAQSPGFSELFDPLGHEIERIRKEWEERRKRTERTALLIGRARVRRDEGALEDARFALQAALEIDTENPEALALLRSVEEAIEARQEQVRRQQAADQEGQRVAALIAANELDRAEEALSEAVRVLGEIGSLPGLGQRITEARAEARRLAVRDCLARAEQLSSEDHVEKALEALREALRIEPDNREVQLFFSRLTAVLSGREEAMRRERAVRGAIAGIDAALQHGDFDLARSRLQRGAAEFGQGPFADVPPRIEKAESEWRDAEKQKARAAARAEIEAAIERRDFDEARRALERGAAMLDAEQASALRTRIADIEHRTREAQREVAVRSTTSAIEAALRGGDLRLADAQLRQAEATFGPEAVVQLRAQWVEAEQALREQEEARLLAAAVDSIEAALERRDSQLARSLLEQATGLDAPSRIALRARIEGVEKERREAALGEAVAAVEAALDNGDRASAKKQISRAVKSFGPEPFAELQERLHRLERAVADSRSGTPPKTTEGGARLAGRPVALVAAALVVGSVGILTVLTYSNRARTRAKAVEQARQSVATPTPAATVPPTPRPPAGTSLSPSESPSPLATPKGVLVLDARPWGELVEVLDARGRAMPVAGERWTPLMLSLDPGTYTVRLRHPDLPTTRSLEVEINARQRTTRSIVLLTIDPEDYLRKAGL